MIARSKIHWITEAGMFFERSGPVWDTLRALDQRLTDAHVDYAVIGGLALNAYNYPRQTVDVNIVLSKPDFDRFVAEIAGPSFDRVPGLPRRFIDRHTDVAIDILIAGTLAGHTEKNKVVRFPEPKDANTHENIRTVPLAKLIELKLVTWRFKDWGDVVELIRRNNLTESFGDALDPSVRTAYKQCFDQAHDPQYGEP